MIFFTSIPNIMLVDFEQVHIGDTKVNYIIVVEGRVQNDISDQDL